LDFGQIGLDEVGLGLDFELDYIGRSLGWTRLDEVGVYCVGGSGNTDARTKRGRARVLTKDVMHVLGSIERESTVLYTCKKPKNLGPQRQGEAPSCATAVRYLQQDGGGSDPDNVVEIEEEQPSQWLNM
jgi:hypothetical protein